MCNVLKTLNLGTVVCNNLEMVEGLMSLMVIAMLVLTLAAMIC